MNLPSVCDYRVNTHGCIYLVCVTTRMFSRVEQPQNYPIYRPELPPIQSVHMYLHGVCMTIQSVHMYIPGVCMTIQSIHMYIPGVCGCGLSEG